MKMFKKIFGVVVFLSLAVALQAQRFSSPLVFATSETDSIFNLMKGPVDKPLTLDEVYYGLGFIRQVSYVILNDQSFQDDRFEDFKKGLKESFKKDYKFAEFMQSRILPARDRIFSDIGDSPYKRGMIEGIENMNRRMNDKDKDEIVALCSHGMKRIMFALCSYFAIYWKFVDNFSAEEFSVLYDNFCQVADDEAGSMQEEL